MNFLMNNLKKCFFVLIRMHFYTYLISYSLILNLLPYSPIVSCHNQTGCETVLKKTILWHRLHSFVVVRRTEWTDKIWAKRIHSGWQASHAKEDEGNELST